MLSHKRTRDQSNEDDNSPDTSNEEPPAKRSPWYRRLIDSLTPGNRVSSSSRRPSVDESTPAVMPGMPSAAPAGEQTTDNETDLAGSSSVSNASGTSSTNSAPNGELVNGSQTPDPDSLPLLAMLSTPQRRKKLTLDNVEIVPPSLEEVMAKRAASASPVRQKIAQFEAIDAAGSSNQKLTPKGKQKVTGGEEIAQTPIAGNSNGHGEETAQAPIAGNLNDGGDISMEDAEMKQPLQESNNKVPSIYPSLSDVAEPEPAKWSPTKGKTQRIDLAEGDDEDVEEALYPSAFEEAGGPSGMNRRAAAGSSVTVAQITTTIGVNKDDKTPTIVQTTVQATTSVVNMRPSDNVDPLPPTPPSDGAPPSRGHSSTQYIVLEDDDEVSPEATSSSNTQPQRSVRFGSPIESVHEFVPQQHDSDGSDTEKYESDEDLSGDEAGATKEPNGSASGIGGRNGLRSSPPLFNYTSEQMAVRLACTADRLADTAERLAPQLADGEGSSEGKVVYDMNEDSWKYLPHGQQPPSTHQPNAQSGGEWVESNGEEDDLAGFGLNGNGAAQEKDPDETETDDELLDIGAQEYLVGSAWNGNGTSDEADSDDAALSVVKKEPKEVPSGHEEGEPLLPVKPEPAETPNGDGGGHVGENAGGQSVQANEDVLVVDDEAEKRSRWDRKGKRAVWRDEEPYVPVKKEKAQVQDDEEPLLQIKKEKAQVQQEEEQLLWVKKEKVSPQDDEEPLLAVKPERVPVQDDEEPLVSVKDEKPQESATYIQSDDDAEESDDDEEDDSGPTGAGPSSGVVPSLFELSPRDIADDILLESFRSDFSESPSDSDGETMDPDEEDNVDLLQTLEGKAAQWELGANDSVTQTDPNIENQLAINGPQVREGILRIKNNRAKQKRHIKKREKSVERKHRNAERLLAKADSDEYENDRVTIYTPSRPGSVVGEDLLQQQPGPGDIGSLPSILEETEADQNPPDQFAYGGNGSGAVGDMDIEGGNNQEAIHEDQYGAGNAYSGGYGGSDEGNGFGYLYGGQQNWAGYPQGQPGYYQGDQQGYYVDEHQHGYYVDEHQQGYHNEEDHNEEDHNEEEHNNEEGDHGGSGSGPSGHNAVETINLDSDEEDQLPSSSGQPNGRISGSGDYGSEDDDSDDDDSDDDNGHGDDMDEHQEEDHPDSEDDMEVYEDDVAEEVSSGGDRWSSVSGSGTDSEMSDGSDHEEIEEGEEPGDGNERGSVERVDDRNFNNDVEMVDIDEPDTPAPPPAKEEIVLLDSDDEEPPSKPAPKPAEPEGPMSEVAQPGPSDKHDEAFKALTTAAPDASHVPPAVPTVLSASELSGTGSSSSAPIDLDTPERSIFSASETERNLPNWSLSFLYAQNRQPVQSLARTTRYAPYRYGDYSRPSSSMFTPRASSLSSFGAFGMSPASVLDTPMSTSTVRRGERRDGFRKGPRDTFKVLERQEKRQLKAARLRSIQRYLPSFRDAALGGYTGTEADYNAFVEYAGLVYDPAHHTNIAPNGSSMSAKGKEPTVVTNAEHEDPLIRAVRESFEQQNLSRVRANIAEWEKREAEARAEMRTPFYNSFIEEKRKIQEEIERQRKEAEAAAAKKLRAGAFPPLTPQQEAAVDAALRSGENQNVKKGKNTTLTGHDFQKLRHGKWLNDELINEYIHLISVRNKANPKLPRVFCHNSFFYHYLSTKGFDSVKRYVKPKTIDVFALDYLVIPINVNGSHWTCVVVDMKNKKIKYLDSMHGNNTTCTNYIKDYLQKLHLQEKKTPLNIGEWEVVFPKDIPVQYNGFDCGVFLCTFMEYVTGGRKFDFTQENIPYLRRRICAEILGGKIFDREV